MDRAIQKLKRELVEYGKKMVEKGLVFGPGLSRIRCYSSASIRIWPQTAPGRLAETLLHALKQSDRVSWPGDCEAGIS